MAFGEYVGTSYEEEVVVEEQEEDVVEEKEEDVAPVETDALLGLRPQDGYSSTSAFIRVTTPVGQPVHATREEQERAELFGAVSQAYLTEAGKEKTVPVRQIAPDRLNAGMYVKYGFLTPEEKAAQAEARREKMRQTQQDAEESKAVAIQIVEKVMERGKTIEVLKDETSELDTESVLHLKAARGERRAREYGWWACCAPFLDCLFRCWSSSDEHEESVSITKPSVQ